MDREYINGRMGESTKAGIIRTRKKDLGFITGWMVGVMKESGTKASVMALGK